MDTYTETTILDECKFPRGVLKPRGEISFFLNNMREFFMLEVCSAFEKFNVIMNNEITNWYHNLKVNGFIDFQNWFTYVANLNNSELSIEKNIVCKSIFNGKIEENTLITFKFGVSNDENDTRVKLRIHAEKKVG